MRSVDKTKVKKLAALLSEAQDLAIELCDNHQEWMEEREEANENWPNTPTGERAGDDQYNFEDWRDTIDSMLTGMEENI